LIKHPEVKLSFHIFSCSKAKLLTKFSNVENLLKESDRTKYFLHIFTMLKVATWSEATK